jgi:hypothetical protein
MAEIVTRDPHRKRTGKRTSRARRGRSCTSAATDTGTRRNRACRAAFRLTRSAPGSVASGAGGGGGPWGRLEAPSRSWARPGEAVSHALLQGSMPQKPGWLSQIRLILARVVLRRGRERRGHSLPTLPRFRRRGSRGELLNRCAGRRKKASADVDCSQGASDHAPPPPTGASRNCGSTAGPIPTATRANLRARRRALHTVWPRRPRPRSSSPGRRAQAQTAIACAR